MSNIEIIEPMSQENSILNDKPATISKEIKLGKYATQLLKVKELVNEQGLELQRMKACLDYLCEKKSVDVKKKKTPDAEKSVISASDTESEA